MGHQKNPVKHALDGVFNCKRKMMGSGLPKKHASGPDARLAANYSTE